VYSAEATVASTPFIAQSAVKNPSSMAPTSTSLSFMPAA
jgi:hypothetical protein